MLECSAIIIKSLEFSKDTFSYVVSAVIVFKDSKWIFLISRNILELIPKIRTCFGLYNFDEIRSGVNEEPNKIFLSRSWISMFGTFEVR